MSEDETKKLCRRSKVLVARAAPRVHQLQGQRVEEFCVSGVYFAKAQSMFFNQKLRP
jgi:hypothetical protein